MIFLKWVTLMAFMVVLWFICFGFRKKEKKDG